MHEREKIHVLQPIKCHLSQYTKLKLTISAEENKVIQQWTQFAEKSRGIEISPYNLTITDFQ
jgi:hypothetical protein